MSLKPIIGVAAFLFLFCGLLALALIVLSGMAIG
jgi:hypothetical protein